MKQYKFRLEALLMLRKSKTTKALEEYGEAKQKTRRDEEELRDHRINLERLKGVLEEERKSFFDAGNQERYLNSIYKESESVRNVKKLLGESKKKEEECFKQYLEAKKEEEMLIRLKEKRSAEYFKEVMRKEERMLEEMGGVRKINA